MASLRSTTKRKEATDSRKAEGRSPGGGRRSVAPAREAAREWLVERARQRIESGFYEDPLILDAAIQNIIDSEGPSARNGRGPRGV